MVGSQFRIETVDSLSNHVAQEKFADDQMSGQPWLEYFVRQIGERLISKKMGVSLLRCCLPYRFNSF